MRIQVLVEEWGQIKISKAKKKKKQIHKALLIDLTKKRNKCTIPFTDQIIYVHWVVAIYQI